MSTGLDHPSVPRRGATTNRWVAGALGSMAVLTLLVGGPPAEAGGLPRPPQLATVRSGSAIADWAAQRVPGTLCPLFPRDNWWHADVSRLPVHARSAEWLASTGATTGTRLHPDFGSSGDPAAPYGIPWAVAPAGTASVRVAFDYADESDPGPYPLWPSVPVEGGPAATGDRHVIVVDAARCRLYELYDAHRSAAGVWTAGSGAVWDLRSNHLRPAGWTSADAAGLPILPGLLRYDEVVRGRVTHAIRFTVARSQRAYLWPARHQAGSTTDPAVPPMGARFRLKASFDISGFDPQTQVVLRAMKTFGLVVADNGSNWFFTGAADNRWPNRLLDQLKTVPAGAFEAVDTSSLQVDPDSARVGSP